MIKDDLGNRMKKYEETSKHRLLSRTPVLIRVDGRAFHTYTKGFERPFDMRIINAMVEATEATAKELGGFELAYVQSDEATFLIQDYEKYSTQGWFDYEINKIVSITASVFTAHFNDIMSKALRTQIARGGNIDKPELLLGRIAYFDARAFNVPYDDVPNAFIWRQKDWIRNSVQMKARNSFSHGELHGVSNEEMKDRLRKRGSDWDTIPDYLKYGTYISKHGKANVVLTYDEIKNLMVKPRDEY